MTDQQKQFLQLAVIEQRKYEEISIILGVDRKILSNWWDVELKEERERLSYLRRIWKNKFQNISFWDFENWFDSTQRRCKYCGITEKEIMELKLEEKIFTKRWTTRGRKLEIERIEPNEKYDNLNNLAFCCYWCNNAKTDEFSENEFKDVGKIIAGIWAKRLNKN